VTYVSKKESGMSFKVTPLAALFLLSLLFSVQAAADQRPHQPKPDARPKMKAAFDVPEILNWLPPNTETLFVARGPFKFWNDQISENPSLSEMLESVSDGILDDFADKHMKALKDWLASQLRTFLMSWATSPLWSWMSWPAISER
jgi:hypothetical protein